MRRVLFLTLLGLLFVLAGCNLGTNDADDNQSAATQTPNPGGSPTITINSPQNGEEVVVNEEILFSVSATDTVGVTRIQLFVDGRIIQTVTSESATGDTSRNALLAYTPRVPGDLSVRVLAYRGSVPSQAAEIDLVVRQTQAQVTATANPGDDVPVIDPNDPTCRALVNTNLNLRRGPGTNYEIVRVLGAGELLPVIGRIQDNSWLQLTSGTSIGWVSASFVTTYGTLCRNIGVVITPTPRNQPTATPTNPLVPTNPPPPTITPLPTNTPIPEPPNLNVPTIGGQRNLILSGGTVTETFGVTIRNQGGAVNGQFANLVRVTPGDTEYDLGVVAGLGAGASLNLTVDLTFDAPGIYTIRVLVDVDDEIAESNETDNIAIIEVTVTAP